ncbi:MAG: hypothetical protein A3J55_01610 [Candidatus Ryanbacteria bacterium RIFCSPHIGHO2_02_FULL_45_17b]|uniref:Uncharacterized protein n=1 Tax=Candidatus Ryanbacteria bacterium RIFCSPHIGHO2_01_FULL_45_22 TaxID=1802114 RepID=A0A1G2G2W0_9BACT|nr:MAG: hypothetical protein A2719_02465 [Candidatus Ryanbacteria bacterium RIFCSPHIGHO2_01_FULL_45_22]OGZ47812.1 MAG: hypothetical protein A3J55_01610 [Candidatus Ryanbacteria bacterium RIFCSPHIGHO2_02_FULL_45_17b]
MKDFFNTLSAKERRLQQGARTTWQTFLFMPTRYWKITLIVFGSIILIILLGDAWLFWRFAHAPQKIPDELTSERFTLKRNELESALQLLREREIKLLQKNEEPPLREIFGMPPVPPSTE